MSWRNTRKRARRYVKQSRRQWKVAMRMIHQQQQGQGQAA
jgi:hypothetical protein